MPGHKPSGVKKIAKRYSPVCVSQVVEGGFSFKFFPQLGQKNHSAVMGWWQVGQTGGTEDDSI